jgi:Integrase core domain
MDLDKYYKNFNYPASSTFLKLLKIEGLKVSKKEVDLFMSTRVEQQQTTIKYEKKKDLGKIVAYYPMSLIQMDIFDLAKYYRDNQGYKYILCIIDVYSRKVWTYKMMNKDNKNVFDCFKTFMNDSNLKKYERSVATILMSDNDSTFINSQFQQILNNNNIIHQPNKINDHHALGLVDSFARTLKKTLTRLFLQHNNSNWINELNDIIKNYNGMPNSALENIKPNNALLEKNHRKIYNINYEKSLYNNGRSDIDVNDKVRIKLTSTFKKGTEARYTDDVFTVKKSKWEICIFE